MTNKTPGKRKWTTEEVKQWYQDTGAFTYANPDDLNIVVKKPRSEGLTVNWANPIFATRCDSCSCVCGCVFNEIRVTNFLSIGKLR